MIISADQKFYGFLHITVATKITQYFKCERPSNSVLFSINLH